MKKSTKMITAAVLSVGLVGGVAAYSGSCNKGFGHWRGDPEQRAEMIVERITDKLDLNAEQIAKLETLKNDLLSLRKEMRENRSKHREELMALITAPQLDRDKALFMLKEKTQTVEERAPQVIAVIAEFSDSLTPEQKQELAETMEKRFHGRWGHLKGDSES